MPILNLKKAAASGGLKMGVGMGKGQGLIHRATPALNLKKAVASGGLVMGSPKKPPFGKKIIDDLMGSPEQDAKNRANAPVGAQGGTNQFKYGVQIKKNK